MKKCILMWLVLPFVILMPMSVLIGDDLPVVNADVTDWNPRLKLPYNAVTIPCASPIVFEWFKWNQSSEYRYELYIYKNGNDYREDIGPLDGGPFIVEILKDTVYEYSGPVKCNQIYFWHVRAEKPEISMYSALFSFTTEKTLPPTSDIEDKSQYQRLSSWMYLIMALGALVVMGVGIWLGIHFRRE